MFAECAGGNVMGWRRNLTGGRFAWVVFAEGQTEGPLDALEWSFGVYDAEGGDESVVDAVTFAGAMAEADADV
jgi:hypothetical protein